MTCTIIYAELGKGVIQGSDLGKREEKGSLEELISEIGGNCAGGEVYVRGETLRSGNSI